MIYAHIHYTDGTTERVDWTLSGGWAAIQYAVACKHRVPVDDVDSFEGPDGTEHLIVRDRRFAHGHKMIGTVRVRP